MKQYIRKFAIWLLSWTETCPSCHTPWNLHGCPTVTLAAVDRVCGVCEQPLSATAIKTHDGKWRCAAHKGQ